MNSFNLHSIFKRTVILMGVLLLLFSHSVSQTVYKLPYTPYGVAFSDYDLDEDNDIFISCPASDTIVILQNISPGTFERIDLPFETGTYIYLCHINNDDYPDILTGNSEGIIYYQNSNGSFDENYIVIPHIHENIRVDDVVDMDNNGFPDILYYAFLYPYGWGIIYNNGDGTFTDDFIHQSDYTELLNTGYLNNDTLCDILISSSNTQPGNYIAYNYNHSFVFDILFDHSDLWVYNSIIDMDSDTDNDILFNKPSILNYGSFLIYENVSNETFSDKGLTGKKIGTRVDVVAYLDGDGFQDIACISPAYDQSPSQRDSIYIFRNTQNWGFEILDQIYIGEPGNYSEKIYSGDLNGDDTPDLLITGYYNPSRSHIRILWNDGTGHFIDSNIVLIDTYDIGEIYASVCPNPFADFVTIKLESKEYDISEVLIYNIDGKIVYHQNVEQKKGDLAFFWNGNDLLGRKCLPGIYFVKILVQGRICKTVKIIKSK